MDLKGLGGSYWSILGIIDQDDAKACKTFNSSRSTYLAIYVCTYLRIYQSSDLICLSTYTSMSIYICIISAYQSICLSVYLLTSLPTYSTYLPIYLSTYSTYLSIYLPKFFAKNIIQSTKCTNNIKSVRLHFKHHWIIQSTIRPQKSFDLQVKKILGKNTCFIVLFWQLKWLESSHRVSVLSIISDEKTSFPGKDQIVPSQGNDTFQSMIFRLFRLVGYGYVRCPERWRWYQFWTWYSWSTKSGRSTWW